MVVCKEKVVNCEYEVVLGGVCSQSLSQGVSCLEQEEFLSKDPR